MASLETEIPVMVRAFKDEPVWLTAIGWLEDDHVEVVGQDKSKSIGFPIDCVYKLNLTLLNELIDAHKAHDKVKLTQLWEQAELAFA